MRMMIEKNVNNVVEDLMKKHIRNIYKYVRKYLSREEKNF
jgi:hypothetical protein